MADGRPNETSIFESRSIDDIYVEIRDLYLRYPQPWVIGYSGGKDSTTVVQIVWKAIERLPLEQRQKPIFVISSDTGVETPVVLGYLNSTLHRIEEAAQSTGMPFHVEVVRPTLNDSFWVNLIGRGYPAPTTRFRWCTDRMKITPANRFIEEKVAQYGEVIMVLGVRKTESATRMQIMNTYQVKGHSLLRRHTSLTGAFVYAPIADFSSDDVWTYLLQVASPWGSENRDLAALYRSASAGECPLVIDRSTPSCGHSRFGCWVCTVAERDASMQALIDHGEDWMEPLLEFRELLASTTDPHRKREFRDIRGRDGRVILKKDGTLAARSYKLDFSRELLRQVLKVQQSLRENGPDANVELISHEELVEIRRIWRTERQDWEDSVRSIYVEVIGRELDWPLDDDGHFDGEDKALLSGICAEYDVPFELVAKMLQEERRTNGLARRAGIQKALAQVLGQEWRTEEQIIAPEEPLQLRLV